MSTALPGSPTDRLCQVIMNGQREAFETAVFDMHQALLPPGFLALAVTHERHEFMPTLLDRSGSQARMAALGLALEFHPDMVAVILRHRATEGINNFFDLHDALAWAAGEGQSRAVGALLEMGWLPTPSNGEISTPWRWPPRTGTRRLCKRSGRLSRKPHREKKP